MLASYQLTDPYHHKYVRTRNRKPPLTLTRSYRISVVMISRLMINLRDPTLHSPAGCDGTVTTSHAGYVSTFMLDDTPSIRVATQTETDPSPYDAWSVIFN
jgi:hypothetical protein